MEPPAIKRVLSSESGRKVMDNVSTVASRVFQERELPRFAFEVGLLNTLAKAMVFAGAPQYLWLYALLEYPVLLVLIVRDWVRTKQVLYFAEFCWIANTLGFLYLSFEAVHVLGGTGLDGSPDTVLWMGPELRLSAAHAFFAIANGPLAMTIFVNRNALVFHDIEKTAGVFIHFTPALVSWTMRWRFAEPKAGCTSQKAPDPLTFLWRAVLPNPNRDAGTATPSVNSLFAFNEAASATVDTSYDLRYLACSLYLVWWLGYGAWLLTIGYDLPNRGWGKSSFKDVSSAIAKLYGIPQSRPRAQAAAYLLSHGAAVSTMLLVLPPLFYHSFALHTIWITMLALSTVHQGARFYHYSFGKRIAKALKQALDAELVESK